MPKHHDHETEEAIDMEMVRLEAAKRLEQIRIENLMDNFFFDFPPGKEEDYKNKLTPNQVVRLVREYTGEMVTSSYLFAILRAKHYQQIIDRSDFPIQVYWFFG
jgi:hypothetical protein